MKTKTIYGLIIILHCIFALFVIHYNTPVLYYLGGILALATIAFFFIIKLFYKESKLFRHISIKQALVFLAIMAVFILAGIIQKNKLLDNVLH